ncbi:MAG: LrgB family protein [Propionibacteriaceae bacterium]
MNLHLADAWTSLVHSPLLGVLLTLAAYQVARALWRKTRHHSLANPVLVAIALVVVVLLLTGIDYDDYFSGAQYISFLLGPATVALALPLHRQARHIRRAALPILVCLVTGAVSAIVVSIVATKALGGSDQLALTMAPKSATTPIAIALSESAGGLPALTAVLTVLTGVLGAVAAPRVLTLLRVHDQRVRGFAIGMSSHGIGTSRAFHESALAGAFSGLAMALNALVTAIVLPVILAAAPWLLRVGGG